MHQKDSNSTLLPIQILVLSTVVIFTQFVILGNKGLNLSDEGYLWYGVQRVMLGEVPIRDFMAYDPGRYYWSATLMSLWSNNGIVALRVAVAIFQAIGLFVGLLLIASTSKKRNFSYLLLSTFTLVVWMLPRHKLFDISLSIFLIGALTLLVKKPTSKRYFLVGLCVGLAAVFGRNHGVYGIVGSFGVMAWLSIKRVENTGLIKGFSFWTAGVTVGFMPVLLMLLLVPGFAIAFWESVRFLFEIKATNLPLPIPWPWQLDFNLLSFGGVIRRAVVGLFFIGMLLFGTLSIAWVVRQKIQKKQVAPAFVAASFLALPYAHYAYSRADINHLAQGIFPLLVGCLVLLATQPSKVKRPLALMLCTMSLAALYGTHAGWNCLNGKQCVNMEVSGDNLLVDTATASDIALLHRLAGQYAQDGQSIIATPYWPGAYPVLERKSPTWEIFAVFPRSPEFERAEIERIRAAKIGIVLVLDLPLDGRNELRFRNTHPLTYQYIVDNFEQVPYSSNPAYQIFKTKY